MCGKRSNPVFAHTLPGQPRRCWHHLADHLHAVAKLAGRYASRFGAYEWGYTAGLFHDLGKFSSSFQSYLKQQGDYHQLELQSNAPYRRVDHTSAGTQYAVKTYPVVGHMLAYAIAGHHAGLLDAISAGSCLDSRLKKEIDQWEHGVEGLGQPPRLDLPKFLRDTLESNERGSAEFALSFFTRMIFSCLVDADFLDTEAFMDERRSRQRPAWDESILVQMEEALNEFISMLSSGNVPVNEQRGLVRNSCLAAALKEPGLFSLTVPTGGGKTLSSLAFALRHALNHRLERIIYVIPFTSIIEQTADVFRHVFRALTESGIYDPVLEHHSALDAGRESLYSRLAAENWESPLVVTTAVQFFESLFSHKPSRCRKLHNLSRTVIILDEAQQIPVDYLKPCLLALRELAANYGSSLVLCTATQPAIHRRREFAIGLENVREIIADPRGLYESLKRVTVHDIGTVDDEDLSAALSSERQALCIVNTRRHARDLFCRVTGAADAIHLSAGMCPEHRSGTIREIRQRLASGTTCLVVSTQLIEAGVDLDFPVVYRSIAGLDAIAQAAGRCNRNGKLESGLVYVFRHRKFTHSKSEAFLRDTVNAASQIFGTENASPVYTDPLCLEAIEHYFRIYYWSQQGRWDRHNILDEFKLNRRERELPLIFNFRSAGRRFKLIQDAGQPLIVPWGDTGRSLVEELRNAWNGVPPSCLLRRLQRYSVQIPTWLFKRELGRSIELMHDRYPVLISPELHYDEKLGVVLDVEDHSAESFLI